MHFWVATPIFGPKKYFFVIFWAPFSCLKSNSRLALQQLYCKGDSRLALQQLYCKGGVLVLVMGLFCDKVAAAMFEAEVEHGVMSTLLFTILQWY